MSKLEVVVDGRRHQVTLELTGSTVTAAVDGTSISVVLPDWPAGAQAPEWALVDDRPYQIVFDPELQWLRAHGGLHQIEIRDLEVPTARVANPDGRLKAPIPGQIARVPAAAGQIVARGDPLVVLEAMKMENEIRSPCAGRVAAVHVVPGQIVALGQLLIEITRNGNEAD
jgi:acetyl/propionyl-CoA carboxylase alpha subunit